MRKLSIIVPVLGSFEEQERSLISVLENRPDDAEVLVVHNRPYEDPYDLSGEVRFVEARRRAGLVECLNLALAASQAPVVHVLCSGIEAVDGWTASPLRHFRDPQVAAVTPLVLSARAPSQIVAAGMGLSRGGAVRRMGKGREIASLGPWTSQILGPSLLAGFYRKSAIEIAGGWDAALGQAADVDLAIRLRAAGHRLLLDPQSKLHASPECDLGHHGFRAGLHAERLFLRHLPEQRFVGALAAHACLVVGEFLRSLPRAASITQLLGRCAAWAAFPSHRQCHREFLEASKATVPARPQTQSVPRPHIALSQRRVTRDAA